jgi:hypothetical protein
MNEEIRKEKLCVPKRMTYIKPATRSPVSFVE